jgi:hypothetical protein
MVNLATAQRHTDIKSFFPGRHRQLSIGPFVLSKCKAEPHQLEIALALALQAATGFYAVDKPLNVELGQNRRMISGAAGGTRIDSGETKPAQVEFVEKPIAASNRVVLGHEIL